VSPTQRTRAALVPAALALALASCDPFGYSTFRNNAPVVTLQQPDNYPNLSFGVDVAFTSSDMHGDWLVTSGGLGTATVAWPLLTGTTLAPRAGDPQIFCSMSAPCGGTTRTGDALGGLPSWQGAPVCALTGAFQPTLHQVHLHCVGASPARDFDVLPPAGFEQAGFGLALATPRRRGNEPAVGDVFFVGAPAGPGKVFLAQPSGVTDATGTAMPSADAHLGTTLALGRVGPASAPDFLLVAGAPNAGQVYVFRGDPRAGRPMRWVACIARADEPGFGGAVAAGDVNGDGEDDVIVGSSAFFLSTNRRVHVYLSTTIPADPTCSMNAWPEAAPPSECVPRQGAVCAGGNEFYGTALTAADLDQDGRDEILAGGPNATVDGETNAGAAWILRLGTDAAGNPTLATIGLLRLANAPQNAFLGSPLATANLGGRDEPLVGIHGQNEVGLFLCSGINGDNPSSAGPNGAPLDAQCRPQ
jgi:hypothetical protein